MTVPFAWLRFVVFITLLVKGSRALPDEESWDAASALREFMRHRDPGTQHATSTAGLRGSRTINEDLQEALFSARISTVQAALEHTINQKDNEVYDEELYARVESWFNELEKRMATIKYCKQIRGQGWDGECLSIDNWWTSVKTRQRMQQPWDGHKFR